MGETRIDLLHLLEDLRDAYPWSLEETIVTEIVANALDSGATSVALSLDSAAGTLTVVDDGKGMSRQALSRYHDLASTSKRRGRSIGFAGVGIKLGLLVADDVVTETRRKRTHLATSWRLSSRKRAPWRWIDPPGMVDNDGTSVRLYLTNSLSQLLDPGFVRGVLLRHFQPILDPDFDEILRPFYPEGVRFAVDGRPLHRTAPEPGRAEVCIRIGRQRKLSGAGYLVRDAGVRDAGLRGEEESGIAVSTLGKVIKRGWDWLGLSPADASGVSGLIEVPQLAEVLTLNKADFVRSGQKGATFLAYRKAVQQAVAAQLAEWGDAMQSSASRRPRTRSLERDLQSVLADLSDTFPLLATLVASRAGGQRRLHLGKRDSDRPGIALGTGLGSERSPASEGSAPADGEASGEDAGSPTTKEERQASSPPGAALPEGRGRKAPVQLGLAIRFEHRPDDGDLGRLVESTVWVNEAHPAYRRAVATRSEGYHLALTVAMALAPLAAEPAYLHGFVTSFLARWGEAAKTGSQ